MKSKPSVKKIVIEFICLSYILLFVYAAISKLLDFQNFRVQLGQSPLIGSFAEVMVWLVPLSELLIALLLILPKCRTLGLYLAFGLMVLFTAYIYLILNYSSVVPCSCGGILEKLGWQEHLLFNVFFCLLAALALIIRQSAFSDGSTLRGVLLRLPLVAITGIALMSCLYLASERIIHYENRFTRRFTHFPAVKAKEVDLKRETYYFAGLGTGRIYLGGGSTQLDVLEADSSLSILSSHTIDLDRKDFPFRSLTVMVRPPEFYVSDGAVPSIFRGSTQDWKASCLKSTGEFFTLAQPVDSAAFVIRALKDGKLESELVKIGLTLGSKSTGNPELLQKQQDGLFDTDGYMAYSESTGRFVYLYAYRNEYIVTDRNLKLLYRGNTIDTISRANLTVVDIKTRGEKKLGKRPLLVNRDCALYHNLLFVNSGIPGRYEDTSMWRQASVIDVYNLEDKSYRLSFYIYHEKDEKLRDFVVDGASFYGLIGPKLVKYKLDSTITKYYGQHKNLLAK